MISTWVKGFIHSLFGGVLCVAYLGDFLFLSEVIITTGGEAVEAFLYLIGCILVTVFGPYAFNVVEESDV